MRLRCLRLAFLVQPGPGEQAGVLIEQDGLDDVQLIPCAGLRSVVEQLARGCVMQPLFRENSVEGVTATRCALVASGALYSRHVLPIQHALLRWSAQQSHGSALPSAGPGPVQWLVGAAFA